MSLLKRLSDGFWSYVSPGKNNATKTMPKTVPRRKPAARPYGGRRASLQDIIRDDACMDPIDRVDSWRDRSPSTASKQRGRKRKYPSTPSTSTRRGRPKKAKVMMEEDIDYTLSIEDNEDINMHDVEENDCSELSDAMSNIHVDRSPPSQRSKGYDYPASDIEVDATVVVTEEEYHRESPAAGRRKLISPTTEHFRRGVDANELRANGWDDDYIILMQKLSLRGFEPLMPAHWKFGFSFMPDALFSDTDDAFVSSARADHFRASKEFEKLLELGSRVRDRITEKGKARPEEQSCNQVRTFLRWAEKDAQLDPRTAIPLLAFVHGAKGTPASDLQEKARKKCAKLALRWRDALRVKQSIEFTPRSAKSRSSDSTRLAHPMPTLYAIVASHTLVALTAYNPTDDRAGEPQVKSAAFFDMADPAYDVWNALAMAIVVCHVRNVQLEMAEDTGTGLRPGTTGSRGRSRSVSEDPDA